MQCLRWISVGVICAVTGCAQKRDAAVQEFAPPATRPSDPAMLALEQIEPTPVLPQPAATQSDRQPPLESLQLYAQARSKQISGDRAGAVALLQKALQVDPDSYELNYALGQVQLGANGNNDTALKAFERAAAIQPDNLDVHLQLGRQYLARNDHDRAIAHLRLALQTSEYQAYPESGLLAHLLLARALQQKGYDIAALSQYEILVSRMQRRLSFRSSPELYFVMTRPELLYMQMGQLLEKHARYAEALENYREAVQREPDNFEYQAHVVRALLGLKRIAEARDLAAELVRGHRASAKSVDLLRETYKSTGEEQKVVEALRKLLRQRPGDRATAFALADVLDSFGKSAEAEGLLREMLQSSGSDPIVLSRLHEFYVERGQTEQAAKLVIEALAKHPELLDQIQPLWGKLLRPTTRNRLRLASMQKLEVGPESAAAKLYLGARLAELWGRESLVREYLEQAVTIKPAFAPAYREQLGAILQREDRSEEQKTRAAQQLIDQARNQNRPELAAELRGWLLLHQKKSKPAVTAFQEAIQLGVKTPDVRYALATAQFGDGQDERAEQTLWDIVNTWPSFDEAYMTLIRRYLSKNAAPQALKVLQGWLTADPFNVNARLLQVNVLMQSDHLEGAEVTLTNLFREEPDNPAIVLEMSRFYARTRKTEELIRKLEDERTLHPDNRVVVDALVSIYSEQKKSADAMHVLDQMRMAVAGDPEQLYFVAHLYERVQRRELTEKVLQEVLRLDPHNSPANNDLGYMWADDGKYLDRAEAMIRSAMQLEPENAAYMDSLGWVLYKRGKFAEAHRYLDEAARAVSQPDPVVLDHLGDALYRLGQSQEATRVWQRSLDGLTQTTADRAEYRKLRLQLRQKLRQHERGEPVDVAPVAEPTEEPVQAKN